MDLVALYVDQVGADDLSRDRAARFPAMKVYPTIAEALTLGGEQTGCGWRGGGRRARPLSAQRKRADKISALRVLPADREGLPQASGRSVPVFNDKHLSWNWEWAKEMYDTSRQHGFPVHGRLQSCR